MSEQQVGYEGKRFDVFVVKDFTGKDETAGAEWTKVGVAFAHKSGKGFNITINPQISVTGKMVVKAHEKKSAG